MEIIGILHKIDEIENYGFQIRFFYLRFIDNNGKMQYAKFRLSNSKVELIDGFEIGKQIKVVFQIEGREVKNNKEELVIYDQKEVYSIQGFNEIKKEELKKTEHKLYKLQEGEEDEPLKF